MSCQTQAEKPHQTCLGHGAVPIWCEVARLIPYEVGFISARPEFKRWFGNSVVVDPDGKPKVVFHGTPHRFTIFQQSHGLGFHFGTIEQARSRLNLYKNNPHEKYLMPVFIKIERPLILTEDGKSWCFEDFKNILQQTRQTKTSRKTPDVILDRMISDLETEEIRIQRRYEQQMEKILQELSPAIMAQISALDDEVEQDGILTDHGICLEQVKRFCQGRELPDEVSFSSLQVFDERMKPVDDERERDERAAILRLLNKYNFDGVIYPNRYEGDGKSDSYIVLDSRQVKSVYNRGSFDPSDTDILG